MNQGASVRRSATRSLLVFLRPRCAEVVRVRRARTVAEVESLVLVNHQVEGNNNLVIGWGTDLEEQSTAWSPAGGTVHNRGGRLCGEQPIPKRSDPGSGLQHPRAAHE